jgi:hypothetical protein
MVYKGSNDELEEGMMIHSRINVLKQGSEGEYEKEEDGATCDISWSLSVRNFLRWYDGKEAHAGRSGASWDKTRRFETEHCLRYEPMGGRWKESILSRFSTFSSPSGETALIFLRHLDGGDVARTSFEGGGPGEILVV